MSTKKRILLKLTGEIFLDPETNSISSTAIKNVIKQIKTLCDRYQFAIVTGGGNFFRGDQQGKQLGLTSWAGHQIGMLATMMNGLMINDFLGQEDIPSQVFTAHVCLGVGFPINHESIKTALNQDKTIIFVGGTGNPFFTTDTNAVLRALEIEADEIWKGTNVGGVYSDDPRTDKSAEFIKELTYKEALDRNIKVMDATAFTLASLHNLTIRVFNIYDNNALLNAAENKNFGSIIHR